MSVSDITPPERLPLGGYTERRGALFERGSEPLFARTLVLKSAGNRVVITSLEMLTIPESLYREVKKRLPSDLTIWLVATHTHCAPDSQMLNDRMTFAIPGIASYRGRWLEWYAEAISGGIKDALDAPQSRYGSLSYKEFRLKLNQPRRPGALPDTMGGELSAPGNRPLLAQYAAHATFYSSTERHLHGDWPGELAKRSGAVVLPGAIGDVSPDAPGTDSPERIRNFVSTFLSQSAVAETRSLSFQPFRIGEEPIKLPTPTPHPEFARRNGLPQAIAENLNQKFAPIEAKVSAMRIGKLAIVGIPGEPTAEIGRRIALAGRGMGFSSVWVISHVNGWIGYILTSDDYARGGYEATLSFYGTETGGRVVDAATRTLRKLASEADSQ